MGIRDRRCLDSYFLGLAKPIMHMRFDYHMLYVEAEEHLGVCRSSLLIAKERLRWVGHVLWSEDSVLRKVLHFKWWCTGLRTPKVPILRHCQARHC